MGLAYLPDGSSMDYKEYIATHPHWQTVRRARLRFDQGLCVVCHRDVGDSFETHHLNYSHLGNEHMTDVVTMCSICHTKFHNVWRKQDFWKGREQNHWQAYDIEHTARLCCEYFQEDKFICKDANAPNLCNKDTQREYIDRYFREHELNAPVSIDQNDIGLFVRNKRWEMWFAAESRGLTMEQFLDETYGQKVRGKNPLRQEASAGGSFQHDPASIRRHYKENKNINLLMKEVAKIMKNGGTKLC